MAKYDSLGLFWNEEPKVKAVRVPPKPTWLDPSYLPGLEEALAFPLPQLDKAQLFALDPANTLLECDVECYSNYFQVAFMDHDSGAFFDLEMTPDKPLDIACLRRILETFQIVTFNGIGYDEPILNCALAGMNNAELKRVTSLLIEHKVHRNQIYKDFKVHRFPMKHIDIKEVTPGVGGGLKVFGGRMHTRRMQDLPFEPGTELSYEQRVITRYYCANDLRVTRELTSRLWEQLVLRCQMSEQYGIDLRSKSDAQCAEAIFRHEMEKVLGHKIEPPTIPAGTTFKYNAPAYLKFLTPQMQELLKICENIDFVINDKGGVNMPDELSSRVIKIGDSVYRMGIGGLHSSEKNVHHIADEIFTLRDADVGSYYPSMIRNNRWYPKHIGPAFIKLYSDIIDRRLAAKKIDPVTAQVLKIVLNGLYGKLGSPYSCVYSPDLMIHVTITGQLSLLMLIEALELSGIKVISANTDGIVSKIHNVNMSMYERVCKWWQKETQLDLEFVDYAALYSRDVNNYIAVKKDGKTKNKGVFATDSLSKNPSASICVDAVAAFLTKKIPLVDTIRSSKDITAFAYVRTVSGGAVKMFGKRDNISYGMHDFNIHGDSDILYGEKARPNEYLGKVVRWYHKKGEGGEIVYAKNGNLVPGSVGSWPIMQLPDEFPANDIDYEHYVSEAISILNGFGVYHEQAA